jgi:hypothetical protein
MHQTAGEDQRLLDSVSELSGRLRPTYLRALRGTALVRSTFHSKGASND